MSGQYITGTGQTVINVHDRTACQGSWCVVHNPAPGPWRRWPTHWVQMNHDPAGLNPGVPNGWMGRICDHGIVHPCVEDNTPITLTPHHPDCDGCPCGPEHIGSTWDAERGVARAKAILGTAEERPLDANGMPARKPGELSLPEKFHMDQDEAAASEALNDLVVCLINSVLAGGGDHPGRPLVPTAYLDRLSGLEPHQVKIVLQTACWALAENALIAMECDGVLAQGFGIRLGKGFRDDHE